MNANINTEKDNFFDRHNLERDNDIGNSANTDLSSLDTLLRVHIIFSILKIFCFACL